VTLPARNVIGSSEQRNKWQGGPPEAGRMPFMPAVNLNQWSGALSGAWSCFGKVFLDWLFLSVFACSAVQSFGHPQRLLSERELLLVLGLSFYPLEQASKHRDLCNEQISDSNERSHLSCGFCLPSPGPDARRCCQKIHLRN
jgi:hypothetical protein